MYIIIFKDVVRKNDYKIKYELNRNTVTYRGIEHNRRLDVSQKKKKIVLYISQCKWEKRIWVRWIRNVKTEYCSRSSRRISPGVDHKRQYRNTNGYRYDIIIKNRFLYVSGGAVDFSR